MLQSDKEAVNKETQPNSLTSRQNIDSLDMLKFVLSLMVIAIHADLFNGILNPWLKTAVPLFFIISSYFFFKKVNSAHGTKNQNSVFKKFIIRNLQLYAFWFVLLSPVTFTVRNYGRDGFWMGVFYFFRGLLFSSTFYASWFITALVIATAIIYPLRKINVNILLSIALVISLAVSMFSTYKPITTQIDAFKEFDKYYTFIFTEPNNSFPVAIFWVVLGKKFADSNKNYNIDFKLIIALVISAVLLLFEFRFFVDKFGGNNECPFALIPFCTLFFIFCKELNVQITCSKLLRKLSTVIYASHFSILILIRGVLRAIDFNYSSVLYVLTLAICLGLAFLIFFLEKKKGFSWLKYSH